MPFELLDNLDPVTPARADVRLARHAMDSLSRLVQQGQSLRLRPDPSSGETIEIPPAAAQLLLRLVADLAAGRTVALIPTQLELTIQQAAEMLGVSPGFLIKEIEAKRLPPRKADQRGLNWKEQI